MTLPQGLDRSSRIKIQGDQPLPAIMKNEEVVKIKKKCLLGSKQNSKFAASQDRLSRSYSSAG